MTEIKILNRRLLVVVTPAVVLGLGAILTDSPFWRGLLIGIALGPLALGAAVAVLTAKLRRDLHAKLALEPPPLPTGSFDYRLALTDLDGNPIQTTAWAGRVLVLNFWATWCAPCVAEMPAFRGLMERTTDLNVQFAFISREAANIVRPFVAKKGWGYPFFVMTGEPPMYFKARGIPATFIIDRSGTIVMRHVGSAAWNADTVVAFVRGLAATPQ